MRLKKIHKTLISYLKVHKLILLGHWKRFLKMVQNSKNLVKEVNNFDRIEKWVDIIFPKFNLGKSSNYNDEDNISYEESQDRLIAIVIFITMIPCVIAMVQINLISTPIKSPRLIEPYLSPNAFCKFQIKQIGKKCQVMCDIFLISSFF